MIKTDTKQAIVDTASRYFATLGYDQVTIIDLANWTGFSEMTLHRHFGGKRNIYKAVLENSARLVASCLDHAWDDYRKDIPEAACSWYVCTIQKLLSDQRTRELIVMLYGRDGRLSPQCLALDDQRDIFLDQHQLLTKLALHMPEETAGQMVGLIEGILTGMVCKGQSDFLLAEQACRGLLVGLGVHTAPANSGVMRDARLAQKEEFVKKARELAQLAESLQ